MAIDKTAIISPAAEIDSSAEIGPYVVIEGKVKIGPRTRVMSHAFINGITEIGPDNTIHPFAVIGHEPQDLSYDGRASRLTIGTGNTIREGVSIHRGSKEETGTIIGDNNYLMGYCHVAHDCHIGNEVIIANGALLAGHVQVEDGAFISGNVTVHQFARIGALTMVGGLSKAGKDVPPFMTVVGDSEVRGVNVVGLRRAGFNPQQRKQIKKAYKLLYRSDLNTTNALKAIREADLGPEAEAIVEFVKGSKRGICRHG